MEERVDDGAQPRSARRPWARSRLERHAAGSRQGLEQCGRLRPISARSTGLHRDASAPLPRASARRSSTSCPSGRSRAGTSRGRLAYSSVERARRRAHSALVATTAKGVRSSWEASAVKRVCRATASSSRSNASFRVRARRPSSLSVRPTSIRAERFDAEMRDAVSLMRSMGRSTRRTRNQPPTSAATRAAAPATSRVGPRRAPRSLAAVRRCPGPPAPGSRRVPPRRSPAATAVPRDPGPGTRRRRDGRASTPAPRRRRPRSRSTARRARRARRRPGTRPGSRARSPPARPTRSRCETARAWARSSASTRRSAARALAEIERGAEAGDHDARGSWRTSRAGSSGSSASRDHVPLAPPRLDQVPTELPAQVGHVDLEDVGYVLRLVVVDVVVELVRPTGVPLR